MRRESHGLVEAASAGLEMARYVHLNPKSVTSSSLQGTNLRQLYLVVEEVFEIRVHSGRVFP